MVKLIIRIKIKQFLNNSTYVNNIKNEMEIWTKNDLHDLLKDVK